MSREIDEAAGILRKLAFDMDRGTASTREREAAKRLLGDIASAANAAVADGCHFSDQKGEDLAVRLHLGGAVRLSIGSDNEIRAAFYEKGAQTGTPVTLPITYDPSVDTFVGNEADTERVPVPGERKGHRPKSAVVVVMSIIVDEIRKGFEGRRG